MKPKKYPYKNPNLKQPTAEAPVQKPKPLEPSSELIGKMVQFWFIRPITVQSPIPDSDKMEERISSIISDVVSKITRYEILLQSGVILYKHAIIMMKQLEEEPPSQELDPVDVLEEDNSGNN